MPSQEIIEEVASKVLASEGEFLRWQSLEIIGKSKYLLACDELRAGKIDWLHHFFAQESYYHMRKMAKYAKRRQNALIAHFAAITDVQLFPEMTSKMSESEKDKVTKALLSAAEQQIVAGDLSATQIKEKEANGRK